MKELEHTPGPWTVTDVEDGYANGPALLITTPTQIVCTLESCSEARANAKLIHAAPEMEAALKAIEDKLPPASHFKNWQTSSIRITFSEYLSITKALERMKDSH